MAVQWQCPCCNEVAHESAALSCLLQCSGCANVFTRDETLCAVCDGPNPWARRDSIHFWCLGCGNTQTLYSHMVTA